MSHRITVAIASLATAGLLTIGIVSPSAVADTASTAVHIGADDLTALIAKATDAAASGSHEQITVGGVTLGAETTVRGKTTTTEITIATRTYRLTAGAKDELKTIPADTYAYSEDVYDGIWGGGPGIYNPDPDPSAPVDKEYPPSPLVYLWATADDGADQRPESKQIHVGVVSWGEPEPTSSIDFASTTVPVPAGTTVEYVRKVVFTQKVTPFEYTRTATGTVTLTRCNRVVTVPVERLFELAGPTSVVELTARTTGSTAELRRVESDQSSAIGPATETRVLASPPSASVPTGSTTPANETASRSPLDSPHPRRRTLTTGDPDGATPPSSTASPASPGLTSPDEAYEDRPSPDQTGDQPELRPFLDTDPSPEGDEAPTSISRASGATTLSDLLTCPSVDIQWDESSFVLTVNRSLGELSSSLIVWVNGRNMGQVASGVASGTLAITRDGNAPQIRVPVLGWPLTKSTIIVGSYVGPSRACIPLDQITTVGQLSLTTHPIVTTCTP